LQAQTLSKHCIQIWKLGEMVDGDRTLTHQAVYLLLCSFVCCWILEEIVEREGKKTGRCFVAGDEKSDHVVDNIVVLYGQAGNMWRYSVELTVIFSPVFGSTPFSIPFKRSFFSVGFARLVSMTSWLVFRRSSISS
jgi:hypothetical protein